jgi:hypothetical protein
MNPSPVLEAAAREPDISPLLRERVAAPEEKSEDSPPTPPRVESGITATPKKESTPIPRVQSAETRFKDIDSNLTKATAGLRADLMGRMNDRDKLQALGNVLTSIVQYARLAAAPKGAPQPAIQMPQIDFSKMNENDIKLITNEIAELQQNARARMDAIGTDIVTERQA